MKDISNAIGWGPIDTGRAAQEATYTTTAILLILASFGIALLIGPLWALVVIGFVVGMVVFFHPSDGLWLSPCLMMLASLIAPPEGFQSGVGYSPELPYWAVSLCLVFIPMLLRYFYPGSAARKVNASKRLASPPRAVYVFLAFCVFSALLGVARGYSIGNVGKQLYGFVLFCAYFLFAFQFAPREQDVRRILRNLWWGAVSASIIYLLIYFWKFGSEGVRKDLTILSAYGSGLAVLAIPDFFMPARFKVKFRSFVSAVILLGVPFFAGYKRGIASFAVCILVWSGLKLRSTFKRAAVVFAALTVVGLLLGTGLLDPVTESAAGLPGLSQFKLGDVQTNYSVFLRVEELRQVLDSLHGVPFLGTGLGSTISWYDPYTKTVWEQETLDIGWGYLLVKMGLLGTLIFIWFLGTLLVPALKRRMSDLETGLFLLIFFGLLQMVADTFMVYFMTAGWMGTMCGFLYQSLKARPGAAWKGNGVLLAAAQPVIGAANADGISTK